MRLRFTRQTGYQIHIDRVKACLFGHLIRVKKLRRRMLTANTPQGLVEHRLRVYAEPARAGCFDKRQLFLRDGIGAACFHSELVCIACNLRRTHEHLFKARQGQRRRRAAADIQRAHMPVSDNLLCARKFTEQRVHIFRLSVLEHIGRVRRERAVGTARYAERNADINIQLIILGKQPRLCVHNGLGQLILLRRHIKRIDEKRFCTARAQQTFAVAQQFCGPYACERAPRQRCLKKDKQRPVDTDLGCALGLAFLFQFAFGQHARKCIARNLHAVQIKTRGAG